MRKFLLLFFGILFLFSLSFVYADSYSRSTFSYESRHGSFQSNYDDDLCQAGQDFVLQINPFECVPQVVRSDLLEEQNVPVFCPVIATQINPLVDVNTIKSISFKGPLPEGVSGLSFHPANVAVRKQLYLDSGISQTIGYAVIVLRQNPYEDEMPEWVQGNVTAFMRYDVDNAFGTGEAEFYLSEVSDEDWDSEANKYSFWGGKGLLRLEDIQGGVAEIGIYSSEDNKIGEVSLKEGDVSRDIGLPGEYCASTIQLRLLSLEAPDKRARLIVDGEVVEKSGGGKFLDNRCQVKKNTLKKTNDYEQVQIYCEEDNGERNTFTLKIGYTKENAGVYDSNYFIQSTGAYEDVAENYRDVTFKNGQKTYGEEGLKRAIDLAKSVNDIQAQRELIGILERQYPDSSSVRTYNSDFNYENAYMSVFINGERREITFDGIYESSKADNNVNVRIVKVGDDAVNKADVLGRGDILELENFAFQLDKFNEDYAEFNIEGKTLRVAPEEPKIYQSGSGSDAVSFRVYVNEINVKNSALIKVIPNIKQSGTETDFSFKIGIEKRAVQLAPEKVAERIQKLNETIEKWSKISEGLGTTIKGFKAACYSTATFLTLKNLIADAGGSQAFARQEVMEKYWRDECERQIDVGLFDDYDACYRDNGDLIDSDVEAYGALIKTQNERLKVLDNLNSKDGVVNLDDWKDAYIDADYRDEVVAGLKAQGVQEVTLQDGTKVSVDNLASVLTPDKISKEEAIEIQRYAQALNDNELSGGFRDSLAGELERNLGQIYSIDVEVEAPKDEASKYKNTFNEADRVVRYTQGMPSVVPVDNNGWYARNIEFLDNGEVDNFDLCNVMSDGRMDQQDDCIIIYTRTGQPINQIAGLSQAAASQLVTKAVKTIESAAKEYKPGLEFVNLYGIGRVKVGAPASPSSQTNCADFMSPGDCNLLFNVCDPVLCPSSRCDLGGTYHVQDVIQSGIIGSVALCSQNFDSGKGVLVPVCLTGVKAGIDGLLSIFQAYQDCLQENLDSGRVVGVCDEIQSIYLCEFFWKQAVPVAKLAIPKILGIFQSSGAKGGGEYLSFATAWSNAEKSVDYFVQDYAVNSYKAFKARGTDEVGTDVCRKFISARYPTSGEFFDALLEPDSPPQFHGRFDEINFNGATVPAQSHYKVFYHIYAGNDIGAYYQVYLRGLNSGTFYQDSATRTVASGYVKKGDYADETLDFLAPAGYKELCIVVNKQEECGFKEVSTSFAVDYIKDQYAKEQATEQNIDSEEDCVSGTSSVFSMLNPNVQQGVDDVMNPAIYEQGIIRVCASENPGLGTDGNANADGSRWTLAGYCDKSRGIKCWLDTKSVKNVIHSTAIEGDALSEVNAQYQGLLTQEKDYKIDVDKNLGDFASKIKSTDGIDNLKGLAKELEEYEEKISYADDLAYHGFLVGRVYEEITRLEKAERDKEKKVEEEKGFEVVELGVAGENIDGSTSYVLECQEECEGLFGRCDSSRCESASEKLGNQKYGCRFEGDGKCVSYEKEEDSETEDSGGVVQRDSEEDISSEGALCVKGSCSSKEECQDEIISLARRLVGKTGKEITECASENCGYSCSADGGVNCFSTVVGIVSCATGNPDLETSKYIKSDPSYAGKNPYDLLDKGDIVDYNGHSVLFEMWVDRESRKAMVFSNPSTSGSSVLEYVEKSLTSIEKIQSSVETA